MDLRKNNRILLVVILSIKVVLNKGKKMEWELIHGEIIFHNTPAILQMDSSMVRVGSRSDRQNISANGTKVLKRH